jgi:hypothetical protein
VSAPKPLTPLTYVTDGHEAIGHIIARGRLGFEAFDRDEKSLGIFETQSQAANALLIEDGGE